MADLIVTLGTSFLTYILINHFKMKKLISSATASSIFCLFHSNSYLILGSSFISMGNFQDKKLLQTLLASVLYFFLFQSLLKYFHGLGGALGSIAFIACLSINLIFKFFQKKLNHLAN